MPHWIWQNCRTGAGMGLLLSISLRFIDYLGLDDHNITVHDTGSERNRCPVSFEHSPKTNGIPMWQRRAPWCPHLLPPATVPGQDLLQSPLLTLLSSILLLPIN
jgi:hypothetical protein